MIKRIIRHDLGSVSACAHRQLDVGVPQALPDVETMSIYYSNSGNLIVPLVAFMLGDKWVFYACVFMGLQTIFFWTHCKKVLSHEKGFNLKKIFFNINIITIIIAITLFFAKIRIFCFVFS